MKQDLKTEIIEQLSDIHFSKFSFQNSSLIEINEQCKFENCINMI